MVQLLLAQLDYVQWELDQTTVRAPTDGYVTVSTLAIGDLPWIELATLLCHVRMQASRAELRLLDPFTDRVNSGGHQKAPAASASVVVEIGIAENGAAFTSNEERRRKKLGTHTDRMTKPYRRKKLISPFGRRKVLKEDVSAE